MTTTPSSNSESHEVDLRKKKKIHYERLWKRKHSLLRRAQQLAVICGVDVYVAIRKPSCKPSQHDPIWTYSSSSDPS